jgi:hypothetical protein
MRNKELELARECSKSKVLKSQSPATIVLSSVTIVLSQLQSFYLDFSYNRFTFIWILQHNSLSRSLFGNLSTFTLRRAVQLTLLCDGIHRDSD